MLHLILEAAHHCRSKARKNFLHLEEAANLIKANYDHFINNLTKTHAPTTISSTIKLTPMTVDNAKLAALARRVSNKAILIPFPTELRYITPSQPLLLTNSQRNWLGI